MSAAARRPNVAVRRESGSKIRGVALLVTGGTGYTFSTKIRTHMTAPLPTTVSIEPAILYWGTPVVLISTMNEARHDEPHRSGQVEPTDHEVSEVLRPGTRTGT